MASWGSNNDIGSAPTFVDGMIGYKKVANSYNAAANTAAQLNAFTGADAAKKGVHQGWVYTTRGTGNRAGRVQRETLVTLAAVANTATANSGYTNTGL